MRDLGIVPDGAILLKNGLIEEVGPTRRVENLLAARGAQVIDATGKVVMPGFVDAHTHLMFPQPPPGDAHAEEAFEVERAARSLESVTAQRLAARGQGWLDAMARHGTTTLEAKTGCGANESAELKVLRVLGVLHKRPLDIVPTYLFRAVTAEHTERVCAEFLFTLRRRRLARFADVEWDSDISRRPLLARFLEAAVSLGFGCKIHAAQHSSAGAIPLAVDCGAASVDHLEYATLDQARVMAAAGLLATLLPCASFRHGHHAPARILIERGVAVALGTNFNPWLTPSLSMQTAVSLACLQLSMTPAEAITAATINAAHALHAAARVGSLEAGKLADVLILHAADYREVGYQLGTNLVERVIKRGEVLY
ncbi:MAG TPA: amidohydrolase family protein [Bryobacteraceae bacterium]|jgi:imidazolonepropionase|nr:amidohydrolase family protein [Bryobacteraceae bacterium]